MGGIVLPYSRGYLSGRGRGACTSTYTSQSGYQKPQVNKKPTKAPNNRYGNNSKLLDVVNAQKPFVAGRANQCLSEWVKLTTDPEVLDIVKHCHNEFSRSMFILHPWSEKFYSGQQAIVNDEIDKLLDLGVVTPLNEMGPTDSFLISKIVTKLSYTGNSKWAP